MAAEDGPWLSDRAVLVGSAWVWFRAAVLAKVAHARNGTLRMQVRDRLPRIMGHLPTRGQTWCDNCTSTRPNRSALKPPDFHSTSYVDSIGPTSPAFRGTSIPWFGTPPRGRGTPHLAGTAGRPRSCPKPLLPAETPAAKPDPCSSEGNGPPSCTFFAPPTSRFPPPCGALPRVWLTRLSSHTERLPPVAYADSP